MLIQLELDVGATHHSVVFMCLGADVEIVIPEHDGTLPRRGTRIRGAARKTNLFQFGPNNPAAMPTEGEACTTSDVDNLRIKLTHGDVLMLSGGDRNVCRRYVI